MKKLIVRELIIFIFLFFFLALWMHLKEWLDHPIQHLEALPSSQFGLFHPFVFTFFVYILILIVRVFIKVVRKFVNTGAKKRI